MISLNHQIFLAVNASDAASPFAVWAGAMLAEWPVGIAMLLAHDPTSSFPSLHATFLFSMAFALLLQKGSRGIALFVMLLGGATAWARIFVGVHYPLDMAGAFLTACLAAVAVNFCFQRARGGWAVKNGGARG